jgi:hypothetical protein
MRWLPPLCILASIALSGCTVHYSSQTVSPAGSVQVNASSGSPLGNAIILGIIAADGVQQLRAGPDGTIPVDAPPLDPARKVNAQDCTRPVDPSAGNLLCR